MALLLLALGLLGGALWTSCGTGQGSGPSPAAPPPPETPPSAASGRELYLVHCARCHEVEGGIGPDLTPPVLASYGTARALFTYIRRAMPFDAPGSLEEHEYWEILAYLLTSRGLLSPDTVLDPETAAEIRLDR